MILLLYTWDDDNNIQNGRGHDGSRRRNTILSRRRHTHVAPISVFVRLCVGGVGVF